MKNEPLICFWLSTCFFSFSFLSSVLMNFKLFKLFCCFNFENVTANGQSDPHPSPHPVPQNKETDFAGVYTRPILRGLGAPCPKPETKWPWNAVLRTVTAMMSSTEHLTFLRWTKLQVKWNRAPCTQRAALQSSINRLRLLFPEVHSVITVEFPGFNCQKVCRPFAVQQN